MAVNMAKRAAAGAMITSVWSEDETDHPTHANDCVPISRRKRGSNGAIALRYNPGRLFAMALSIFVALSFVSYATYAHQWSELSALRHLGKASPANELNGNR
jgi:hypothetical protein